MQSIRKRWRLTELRNENRVTRQVRRAQIISAPRLIAELERMIISELFWASLHGIAELTRTKRFPRSRQKERGAFVELFTLPRGETAQVVKVR